MTKRTEYLGDDDAPKANSLVPAASTVVLDDEGAVLLHRRADNGYWSVPGGAMEPGEDIATCARRETFEETGIEVEIVSLVGVYSDPRHVVAYGDGEVRQEFSVCFLARPVGGALKVSEESTEVAYVPVSRLGSYAVHPSVRRRIDDALNGGALPVVR